MKSLLLYSTIVGGFFIQSDALEAAIQEARHEVGDDVWKRGFSGSERSGATFAASKHLRNAQIKPIIFEGDLIHVGFVENRDPSGNVYPKLRVGVQNLDDQYLLSLDLKGDVAQRLIVKLDNCQLGDRIRISAWPTFVERDGRKYVNHAASVKSAHGREIPGNTTFSATVETQTQAIGTTLRAAGITDKKVIATAKATKRIEAYKSRLIEIQTRFIEESTTN